MVVDSSIRGVRSFVSRNHGFIALAHREQFVLAHDVLAAVLHVVFVDAGEHDRIDWTGFFAKAAIDALEQVDVVARRPTGAIGRNVSLS